MVQSGQITLYTSIVSYAYTCLLCVRLTLLVQYSPYGHRVQIALEEANAKYTLQEVNTMNKPAYFTQKVNPLGKVHPQALVYSLCPLIHISHSRFL